MSSKFTIGLSEDSRPSRRIVQPPGGGGHTDIFNRDPEPVRGRRQRSAIIEAASEQNSVPSEQNGQASSEAPQAEQKQLKEPAPNLLAASVNPEVGAKQEAAVTEPAKAEQQKRVHVPPGGYSAGFW